MSKVATPYKHETSGKKEQVTSMFNNIAAHYDFLNHFLSLGIDTIWRKKVVKLLKNSLTKPAGKQLHFLDVATGTADLAIEIAKLRPQKITGVDISKEMLLIGKQKIKDKKLEHIIELSYADSENLPFANNNFNAISVGFGVRNFEDMKKGLNEMYRVLKKEGVLVVLEFSKPKIFPFKQLFNFYFLQILPMLGHIVSKNKHAYKYLPKSVLEFPNENDFKTILYDIGFRKINCTSLTLGICSIYTGIK